MGKHVGIYRDKSNWLRLSFAYDAEVIVALKVMCGRGSYRFDLDSRTWYVIEAVGNAVAELFRQFEYEVETDVVSTAAPSPPGAASTSWAAILSDLTDEQVHRLYRAAAKALHPDAGGNEAQMRALNSAYQRRKER